MPGHHHRSGSLRQSNKRNKRSKASKRSLARASGGRVNVKSAALKNTSAKSKADRKHAQKQRRDASRLALLNKKRGIHGRAPPPRVIGILSLGESVQCEEQLKTFLLKSADQVHESGQMTTAKYNAHKKQGNITFITRSSSGGDAVLAALDLCRVCDMILFVIDANGPVDDDVLGMDVGTSNSSVKSSNPQDWHHLISEQGDRILAAVKGQGLATPVTILAHTQETQDDDDCMTMQSAKSVRRSALKKHADLKRYVSRFATTEFGANYDKVMEVHLTDSDDDHLRQTQASALLRTLCTMSASPPRWVAESPRAYLLADSQKYHESTQQLDLIGHVRGTVPFNVNSLIHVPGLGTFACKSVKKAVSPLTRSTMERDDKVLYSDPNKRESLEMFATPHALDGEQNLVGFDEEMHHDEYDAEEEQEQEAAERPAGWSDYQSAWLDAVDDLDDNDELDHGELAKELNRKPSAAASVVTGGLMDMEEDNEISAQERQALLEQRRKDKRDELEFPDEVEVAEDVNARDRYARYRSLKSFRKSYWDPKENLPDSFGSIYHFSSFKATQRDVFADMKDVAAAANAAGDFWGFTPTVTGDEMDDNSDEEEDLLDGCVPSGSYVTVTLEGVSSMPLSSGTTLVAVSLLPHENKASVLHMGLCQSSKCDHPEEVPVKSKDVLTFRCGWRTWTARPVFSQNNLNSDKHKFERFLPQGGAFFAASVFGPVTYTPCPVLVFREGVSSSRELIAIGSMQGADADRIVVKRIILTGYPTRVHKRHATVKYMFYNPDDVRWFQPAGLSTKHGLNGNIVESVGEHGTMKCLFNAPIKQHDTVCLPLYKRIFPKFAPGDTATLPVQASAKKTDLVVL